MTPCRACWSSTTTTRSSTTSSSTWVSSAPSRSCTATTRSSLDEMRALEPDAVLISPGPGRPADAGPLERRDPRLRRVGHARCSASASGCSASASSTAARSCARRSVMHGKTSEITPPGVGVFAGLPEPVHRHPLPLARRRPRDRARRARDHRGVRGRARHGAAPPRVPDRGRAVPPRVDPHDRRAPAPGELPGRRRARKVRAPARDLGEPVVEQRREHFTVELAPPRPDPRAAAPSRCPRRCRNDPSKRRLAMLRLVGVRSARRARRRRSGSDRTRACARCTPSRRDPSPRAAGRAAASPRPISRTHASASGSERRSPRTRSQTRRMFTSMPTRSSSSTCAATAAAV